MVKFADRTHLPNDCEAIVQEGALAPSLTEVGDHIMKGRRIFCAQRICICAAVGEGVGGARWHEQVLVFCLGSCTDLTAGKLHTRFAALSGNINKQPSDCCRRMEVA